MSEDIESSMELVAMLKKIGVQNLAVDTSIDSTNYPYSGRQMVVAQGGLCQHIELRAKTLRAFIDTAQRFWDAVYGEPA